MKKEVASFAFKIVRAKRSDQKVKPYLSIFVFSSSPVEQAKPAMVPAIIEEEEMTYG